MAASTRRAWFIHVLLLLAVSLCGAAQQSRVGDVQVAYSPDGSKIAFASDRLGNFEIYVWELGQTIPQRVTMTRDSDERMPAWSPDGKRLAYSKCKKSKCFVMVTDFAGGGERRISKGDASEEWPAFSPDGKRIAFSQSNVEGSQIVVMNVDGSGNPLRFAEGNENNAPAWSPEGKLLAFEGDAAYRKFQLFEVNVQNGDVHVAKQGPQSLFQPVYSPYGDTLVYLVQTKPDVLDVQYLHHGLVETLTSGKAKFGRVSWHPGGNWILTTSNEGGLSKIYRINFDGSKKMLPFDPKRDLSRSKPAKK